MGLLFPLAVEISVVGFVLLFIGVLLTAPEADSPRPLIRYWWQVLALTALVLLAGLGLGFVSAGLGGIFILASCVTCLIVVGLAWPGWRRGEGSESAT